MNSTTSTIVWFRQDLRVQDNPALKAACEKGAVIPLFILDEEEDGEWSLGGASRWWLHHSLSSLSQELAQINLQLIIRKGKVKKILKDILAESGANAVFWNRRYEPSSIQFIANLKDELTDEGIETKSFNGSLLFEPWTIANKQGKPFQVFTPFWKTCKSLPPPEAPLPKPHVSHIFKTHLKTTPLDSLGLLPKIPWDKGFYDEFEPGIKGAHKSLEAFLNAPILNYLEARDFPALDETSKISPYLHFGEISSRMIWHRVLHKFAGNEAGVEGYLRQLGWREFAHHLLYHFPKTPTHPLRSDYQNFPWKHNKKHLGAWQKGLTGYPFVDAGMRQLWHTGWMHNRVRMVVGSFLVKDLLLSWTEGAKWFWDTLVDADLANNTMGWQWVGGCGADAAPYFRIFNPITQGEKFDSDGDYIRKWVPELAGLPNKWIHHPWDAPELLLRGAGVNLGKNYPNPIVDHAKARLAALDAFAEIKQGD